MRVALAGLGFFSEFHVDAWERLAPSHAIVGVADPLPEARSRFTATHPGVPTFASVEEMLKATEPDVLDVVVRPELHEFVTRAGIAAGADVICQKPLAPTMNECSALVDEAEAAGRRLLVHDNWRFQPWWSAVRDALEAGRLGRPFFAHFRIRSGDGAGDRPFPNQPYFALMPRLLFYETAIHQIDTFRSLFGEITELRAIRGTVREDIAGEDIGAAVLRSESGVIGVIEGNRWTAAPEFNPAFGNAVVEGTGGVLVVANDGTVSIDGAVLYESPPASGYRGDSVMATTRHLVAALESGTESPLEARNYLRTMAAVFRAYE
jgi:predicted dehydrogenase